VRGEVPGGGTPGRRQEYFLGSALKANVARSVKNSSSHSFVSLLSRARRGGVRDHAGYSSRRWKSLVTEPQIRTLSAISRSSPPLGSASLLMHHAVLTRLPPWPRTKARRPHDCPKPLCPMLLRASAEFASAHVLNHALAQRADGIRTHWQLLSWMTSPRGGPSRQWQVPLGKKLRTTPRKVGQ
jgi:hypothetical protein